MAFVATYVQEGENIDYTPVADVAAGDVILLGTLGVGCAVHPIPANTQGALVVEGVFDFAKYANEAISLWDKVYFDQGTLTATKTAGYGEAAIGIAVLPAGASDATVRVKLVLGM